MVDLEERLAEAIKLTKRQPIGSKFVVRKLFSGTYWDELTVGEKRLLGTMYSNAYKNGNIPGIIKLENNKQHHSVYERISK